MLSTPYRRRVATMLFAATAGATPAEVRDHRIPETVLKRGAQELHIQLETTSVIETPAATHLGFRIVK